MKKQTLRANNNGVKDNQSIDHKIDILSMAKKRCGELFKQRFEAQLYENVHPKDVRLQIKGLTRDDVIYAMDINGIVDIDTLVEVSVKRSLTLPAKAFPESAF